MDSFNNATREEDKLWMFYSSQDEIKSKCPSLSNGHNVSPNFTVTSFVLNFLTVHQKLSTNRNFSNSLKGEEYSVTQSQSNSYGEDDVLDRFNNASRDEDNILYQIYEKEIFSKSYYDDF